MKRILRRSYLIFAIAIVFLVGLGFLTFKLIAEKDFWLGQAYNGHTETSMGTITDRNQTVLAKTNKELEREYNEDEDTRRALLHVIGDGTTNISTSIETMYSGKLTGYNIIFGMGMPDILKINSDIELTLDSNATTAAYNALDGNRGACVVYNYKTGEVLVDTSSFSYDPYDPPKITKENEKEYEGTYIDNVVSSSYTPGSIFKIITATAAIESVPDIYNQTFECSGEYELNGEKITCEDAHGTLTLEEAFKESCNCAFGQIALEVGHENLSRTAEEYGFNKNFSLSNIEVEKSFYDTKTDLSDYDLAWSGIGQYNDLSNPLHMSIMCAAIANGGKPVLPYLVSNNTNILAAMGLTTGGGSGEQMISPDVATRVKELMSSAGEYYSNGSGIDLGGLNFCAKTGTAEVGKDKEPNAWFVGFTNDENHPYAFAVVVQEGGYGISAAAPIASAAISALVNN